MTLNEAIDKKIERVRREPWNKYAHVLLPAFHGPWSQLIDPCSNVSLNRPALYPNPVLIMAMPSAVCFDPTEDVWEEWKMPEDFVERFGQPPRYAETFK